MAHKRGYWTKERCIELALQCSSRKELSEKSRACYTISHRKGWLDEICAHMNTIKRAPPNYWTKENCQKEALKYETRSSFEKGCLGAYTKARRKNWLDEICAHMYFRQRGIKGKKKLYSLTWLDENAVYIGITNNPKRRFHDHLKDSSNLEVKKLISKGLLPKSNIISEWLNLKDIVQSEQDCIDEFERKGWNVLNMAKGGAIGGISVKWSKEECFRQAKKYTSRGDFESKESGCYKASLRLGIYEEVCAHMNYKKLPNNYWTKDKCGIEALKYKTRTKFYRGSGSAYNACLKNGWLDEVCKHMNKGVTFSVQECEEAAQKYYSKSAFLKADKAKFKFAKKKGWLNDICKHMPKHTPKKYWTYERCKEEALKYKRRTDLEKNSSRVRGLIRQNGWDELLSHMEKPHSSRVYWTEERIREEIKKYPTKKLMRENNSKCMQAINRLKLGHLFESLQL